MSTASKHYIIENTPRFGRFLFVVVAFLFVGFQAVKANDKSVQTCIHLLDYVARDYSAAVSNGEIINAAEYEEMQEFGSTIFTLAQSIEPFSANANDSIYGELAQLQAAISAKASPVEIAQISKAIKTKIMARTNYKAAPLAWPDLASGAVLYQQNCVTCHGENGDGMGILAADLDPAPTNFLDHELLADVSPLQAFNTITLGVEGTAMRAFSELSAQEIWDIAFYVKSMRFQPTVDSTELKQQFSSAVELVNLDAVASKSDNELLAEFPAEFATDYLAAIRLLAPVIDESNTLHIASDYLQKVLNAYANQSYKEAKEYALSAYLEGIEPVEAQLRAHDPTFVARLEEEMMGLRTAIDQKQDFKQVEYFVQEGVTLLAEAEELLQDSEMTFGLSFLLTASILLREGLEAFLIIALMLALIRSTGSKRAAWYVHSGWFTAVFLGFLAWFAADALLNISGKNRELLEGSIALFAVVILVLVGFWLHSNSNARTWKIFVEDKVKKLITTENSIGIAVFAFMVVFREAFESVLFLKAISLETADEHHLSIGLGVLVSFAIIATMVVLFIKYSAKLPLRQLFLYSSIMISVLAVILMGKGIHAIQETGIISAHAFPIPLRIEWLGIYPTTESILSQMAVIAVIYGLILVNRKRLQSKLA